MPALHENAAANGNENSAGKPLFEVVERFVSINGEGRNAGYPAAFIRFKGCNLNCGYCDTAWANAADCPSTRLSASDIVRFANDAGVAFVTLTGGEPLLQPHLEELVDRLIDCPHLTVELETNGSQDLTELDRLRKRRGAENRVQFTMDCKLPTSGCFESALPSNYALLAPTDCVKFVMGSERDFDCACAECDEHGLTRRCTVFFSPVFGQLEPARIAQRLVEQKISGVRLQLQLHKAIWPGVEKGV